MALKVAVVKMLAALSFASWSFWVGKLSSCSEPILLSMTSPSCQPCCLLLASYPDNARVRLPVDAAVDREKEGTPLEIVQATSKTHTGILRLGQQITGVSFKIACRVRVETVRVLTTCPLRQSCMRRKEQCPQLHGTLRGAILVLPGHVLTDPLAASWKL